MSLGYVDSTYWLKITVESRDLTDTHWLLEFDGLARSLDEVDAWLPDGQGRHASPKWHYHHYRSGDRVAFDERSLRHHAMMFPVVLPPKQPVTLYFRVRTNGTLQVPTILWSTGYYAEVSHTADLQEGVFYGILIVMVFYNAFIFLIVRDVSYLYYVAYLICVVGFSVSLKGLGLEYLWPESPNWNNKSNLIFASLANLFLISFAICFLQTKINAPRLHRVLVVLVGTSTALVPVVIFASHSVIAMCLSIQYVFSVGVVLCAASIALGHGYMAARYYLLAWLGVLVAVLAWVLNSFSVIDNSWVGAYSFQLGTVIQVVMFSFALADRINLMRHDREAAIHLQLEHADKLVMLSNMFEKFVPKQFLSRIARRGIENIELGKAEDEVISVMFADIRGFTSLSEAMSPQELLNFLNSYFSRIDGVIHRNRGFIDKFLGDGAMAIFEGDEAFKSARHAVKAAIEMQCDLVEYNQYRENSGYQAVAVGIGINTGNVVISTVGSHERMDSTVLGDNVNLASRLQELTKIFGVKIIISEQTQAGLAGDTQFLLRELGDVLVRGRQAPVRLYEVFNTDSEQHQQDKLTALPTHRIALECFRRGEWAWARMLWDDCQRRYPYDSVYLYMLERCDLHLLNVEQATAENTAL
ncbi:Adenylate/guanylate cyclase [gamma proteobacterium HdN1]|nr:Adenylate/guanylate cyclase [gamma proteobacterium HdN1]